MNWVEEILISCPQCGEEFAIQIETAVDGQVELIEDCAVCCRPSLVKVISSSGQLREIEVTAA